MSKKKRLRIKATEIDCPPTETRLKDKIIVKKEHLLSDTDRLTYVFIKDSKSKIEEVVNVSYEIYYKRHWITLVRYDSEHGYMHRHMRMSLNDEGCIISTVGVIKKGGPNEWLPWAIKNTHKVFYEYKIGFCKRSNIDIIDI